MVFHVFPEILLGVCNVKKRDSIALWRSRLRTPNLWISDAPGGPFSASGPETAQGLVSGSEIKTYMKS